MISPAGGHHLWKKPQSQPQRNPQPRRYVLHEGGLSRLIEEGYQAPHIGKECARGEDENARVLPVDMGELGQPDPAVLQEPPRKREVTHADIDQDNEVGSP